MCSEIWLSGLECRQFASTSSEAAVDLKRWSTRLKPVVALENLCSRQFVATIEPSKEAMLPVGRRLISFGQAIGVQLAIATLLAAITIRAAESIK